MFSLVISKYHKYTKNLEIHPETILYLLKVLLICQYYIEQAWPIPKKLTLLAGNVDFILNYSDKSKTVTFLYRECFPKVKVFYTWFMVII